MKKPSIVLTGHVCIDHNVTEHASYHSWGSPPMYMADFYTRSLGISPTIIASYGPDFLSHATGVRLIPDEPNRAGTLLYRNVITSQNRSWYSENVEFATAPDLVQTVKVVLNNADIFIFGPLIANYSVEYVLEMLASLKKDCVKVLYPQGYLRTVGSDGKIIPRPFPEADMLLSQFDVTVLSEDDYPDAPKLIRGWLPKRGEAVIVLTQGSKGATIFNGTDETLVPTTPVPYDKIIDSVGCGDVFVGSLAYEYSRNNNIVTAVKRAHVAASAKLLATNSDAQDD